MKPEEILKDGIDEITTNATREAERALIEAGNKMLKCINNLHEHFALMVHELDLPMDKKKKYMDMCQENIDTAIEDFEKIKLSRLTTVEILNEMLDDLLL